MADVHRSREDYNALRTRIGRQTTLPGLATRRLRVPTFEPQKRSTPAQVDRREAEELYSYSLEEMISRIRRS